jgi:Ca2+-binding RTX toxin-like protein
MTILLALVAVVLAVGSGAAMAATIACDGGDCFGTNRADSIFGTDRHDAIFAKKGADFVVGRESADDLNGQDGDDDVFGGRGDDWVKGGRHDDSVKGDLGNDRINGGSGHNTLRAGDGMRDLIVCGNNSRNRIFYDPDLDRFRNCRFLHRTLQSSGREGSTSFVVGLGGS